MSGAFDELTESQARSFRTAPVEPSLRALFAQLPRPVELHVQLPADVAIALPVRQLVKLAGLGTRLELGALRGAPGGEPLRVRWSTAARSFELCGADLHSDVRVLSRAALAALFDREELAGLLDAFAVETSKLAAIQRVVRAMLASADVRGAVHAMLTGITSGDALGFNRAALFVRDAASGLYVGSQAVGPRDAEQAHRIWEEIEVEDKSIDEIVSDYAHRGGDARLEDFVRTLTLRPDPREDDEVAAAGRGSREALLFRRSRPRNESLAALGAAEEFVLAAVRPGGQVQGLIFADNVFGRHPIGPGDLRDLEFFIEQAALVWGGFTLRERVEALAMRDGLTDLLNRREFEARLASEAARPRRAAEPCAILLVDLDHFKAINDTHGHARGDDALRQLSEVLRRTLRSHDTVARFGGDEFVVLMSDAPREDACAAARRLGRAARDAGISVSIGVATWPEDCDDVAGLLAVADANLYRAKNAGRGRACATGAPPAEF